MLSKLKNFFKITTWKRWFILVFIVISSILFIGLSFGLKSKDSKFSNDYKNGVSLTINPTNSDGSPINNETYSKQLLFNLQSKLENDFSNSIISTSYENNDVWNINITNIDLNKLNDVVSNIFNKQALTLLPINAEVDPSFFQSSINNNSLFNTSSLSSDSFSLTMNSSSSKEFYSWANKENLGDKVIIWKNFDILNNIVRKAQEEEGYSGTIYEYLFVNRRTPENSSQNDGENGTTLDSYLFKEEFNFEGKIYKPSDFIVSKNDLSSFNASNSSSIQTLRISKDFGVINFSISNKELQNEYYNISFWISTYKFNNYIISEKSALNGSNSYLFLIIALTSIFLLLSIFVVINYGYLGIFSIIIMAAIIFLALLMISVFFGDYDSISIISILFTLFICLDFVVFFLERIKHEFFKGNSISKSIKNVTKNSKKATYLKAILMVLVVSVFYSVISAIFNQFSLIALISCASILILLIPLLIGVSNMLINLPMFESNPKLIGLWKKEYKELHFNTNISNNDSVINQEYDELDNNKIDVKSISHDVNQHREKDLHRYGIFKRSLESKSWIVVVSTYIIVFIVGLVVFLVNFFNNGKTLLGGLNISSYDKEQTVLRISKNENEYFTNDEVSKIKEILESKNINNKEISVENNKLIEVHVSKDYSSQSINEITQELTNLYDLIIIPSNLISSNTYKVMLYTLYGILIAMVLMCVFVLLWMNWSHALILLISSIIVFLTFIFMALFGLIQFGEMLSIAALFVFVIFFMFIISSLSRINYKLKITRIEQLTSDNIKELVYKQFYKMIKPFIIVNLSIIISFIILAILPGSIPLGFALFMIIATIINAIFTMLLLPKIIIWLETLRAKFKRKIILDNYWDTEKIKEQNFKGINDIK
ncbi:MAG: hypothetical protein HDR43_00140 [Mycoplasma sp.]|nr:hypothetical protein [Mycoplasma sp.]